MHELSVTQNIIKISCEEAEKHNVTRVKEIRIKVGELTGLVPQAIQYYFEIASKGTRVENAIIKVEKIPIKIKCNVCNSESEVNFNTFSCRQCGGKDYKIIGGNEFFIESLEVE